MSDAPAPTGAGDSLEPADTAQAGSSRRASEADVGRPVGQGRSMGVPPSPARPASYAAAAAAASPASASPSRAPRRSSGASHGLQSMGVQTDRATSRQQPHIRAASMTPPRRRTSDTPGGAPSGPQTHRGPPPMMHRLSGTGLGDGGHPRADPDAARGNASMGDPTRASGLGGDGMPHASLQIDDIRSISRESVSRMVAVHQLNFTSMQQRSSGSGTTAATQQPVPHVATEASIPQLGTGCRQRRSSGSMIASADPAAPQSAARKLVPQLSLETMHQPRTCVEGASAAKQAFPTSLAQQLVPRLSIGSVQRQGQESITTTGATRSMATRAEPTSERPMSAGSAHSCSSSSSTPSSDESRGRPTQISYGNRTSIQAASGVPRLCLDMSQLPRNLRAAPAAPMDSNVALTRSGAQTSRLHRTSGSSGSGSSQGDASDGRPLTARTERRSLNPFACLLRMSGAANSRAKNAGAKGMVPAQLPCPSSCQHEQC